MIAFLLMSFIDKLSIFKAGFLMNKPVVDFCNLMSADYNTIMESFRELNDIQGILERYQEEVIALEERWGKNSRTASWQMKSYFREDDGSETEVGLRVRKFITNLAALGGLTRRLNDYALANKQDIKVLISRCFNLSLAEKQSLENSNEANISGRLDIKGMSLIILVICKQSELVFKYRGIKLEIAQSLGYQSDPSMISEECGSLDIHSVDEIANAIDALKRCTRFTAGVVDVLLGKSEEFNKKPETPQLDNKIPNGGMKLSGG